MTEKQNIENWMSMSSITEYLDVSRETVLQIIAKTVPRQSLRQTVLRAETPQRSL